jgi:hypothetical protein
MPKTAKAKIWPLKTLGVKANGSHSAHHFWSPFWSPFWTFNGIFYSITSSISLKKFLKIFNVINNGIFYSKYHQFPKKVSNSTILSIQLRSIKD